MDRVDLIIGEGATELAIAKRLLDLANIDRAYARSLDKRGQENFWRDFPRYLAAARQGHNVFALADLETALCPSLLLSIHVSPPCPAALCLRFAIRMAEAWLLADVEGIARWLRISQAIVPRDPETLPNPKRDLVNLARRSPVRRLRDAMVPELGSSGIVGREYLPSITEFIGSKWSPMRAARQSTSLNRALAALRARSSD